MLDDDIEFYNEAEPVTTQCPLLPGQPVNVLNVPVILPDSKFHSRENSASSQQSDYRTMKPEDKYMNPRQPPKPKLRLKTSPSLLQQPHQSWNFNTNVSPSGGVIHRSVSQPSNASHRSKGRDIRGATGCKAARSASPPRSRGLRAAFRYLNGHSSEDSAGNRRDGNAMKKYNNNDSAVPQVRIRQGDEKSSNGFQESQGLGLPMNYIIENRSMDKVLPRQSVYGGYDGPASVSIQNRGASNSESRDPSPPRNFLALNASSKTGQLSNELAPATAKHLEPLSDQNSSVPQTTMKQPTASREPPVPTAFNFRDKRLPTLPNSPSSVMDEAVRAIDAQFGALDMEVLWSRFSDFNTTDESTPNDSPWERSRFSEWSTDTGTDTISPDSMVSSSTFNNKKDIPSTLDGTFDVADPSRHSEPATPYLTANSQLPSPTSPVPDDSTSFYLTLPRLSLTLSPPYLDIPGLSTEELELDRVESNPKRHAALFDTMESLSNLDLPRSPDVSSTTIIFPENGRQQNDVDSSRNVNYTVDQTRKRFSDAQFPGLMQEMMDELSYLKNLIEDGF